MIEAMTLTRPGTDRACDLLLATKLQIPSLPSTFIHRPRLTQQINVGLQGKLTLVCAPAGFGKTSLLSDWHAQLLEQEGTAAWVSLDRSDNDPIRFWNHIIAALEQSYSGIARDALALLQSVQPAPIEHILSTLINAASNATSPIVLILDDYHVIEAEPIHHALLFLLEHLPAHCHLILLSRSEPPLPLARLRSQGLLHEVRTETLRFSQEETSALLQRFSGISLTQKESALLQQRTEGWISGLRLAALALQQQPDHIAFLNSFTGTHRYIIEYFQQELLNQQPEAIRIFLAQISILEHMSGPLCDAVVGQTGSQAILEQMQQHNLFLIHLDEEQSWYRLHPLLADVLRRYLQQSQPDLIPALHLRAAAWYEQQGHIRKAISHVLAAGDYDWAAALMEQEAKGMLLSEEYTTLQQWLQALPTACLERHARLIEVHALLSAHMNPPDVIEPLQQIARPSIHTPTLSTWQGTSSDWQQSTQPDSCPALIEPLSQRELEVLHLLAIGKSNREIADALIVSMGTIKTHLKHIFGKLGVHTRTQALISAASFRLLPA